jgi:hypothetical protein
MNCKEMMKRANELLQENVKEKYYEMVLCFSLQDVFNTEDEQITEKDFRTLLSIMTDYLESCYRVAPYDVADSIMRLLIAGYSVAELEADFMDDGTLLEDEVCNM